MLFILMVTGRHPVESLVTYYLGDELNTCQDSNAEPKCQSHLPEVVTRNHLYQRIPVNP
jgi:hypothetical protein